MNVETRSGGWSELAEAAVCVRDAVFVVEQGISKTLEHDGCDATFFHVVLFVAAAPVATGRMSPTGKIGRVAVLSPYRRRGLGKKVMAVLEGLAIEKGLSSVFIHAQSHVIPFYRKLSYVSYGDPFWEAGIPHHGMRKFLFQD